VSVGSYPRRRSTHRWRRRADATGAAVLSVALLIWWFLPLYNMLLIALDPEGDTEFTGDLWPKDPTLKAFAGVFFEGYW
jgi:ABC-type glycerol-3-phosphate transport system permease component